MYQIHTVRFIHCWNISHIVFNFDANRLMNDILSLEKVSVVICMMTCESVLNVKNNSTDNRKMILIH